MFSSDVETANYSSAIIAIRLKQMAFFNPSNRHPYYKNLCFVGASTHPGTGIPTAMVSGRLVSKRIMDDLGV